jgi:hypothetical protein
MKRLLVPVHYKLNGTLQTYQTGGAASEDCADGDSQNSVDD